MLSILRLLRLTLQEMFLWVTFFGLACIALKTAGIVWWMTLSAGALLMFMGCALFAALDRGPRQSFALGFIICAGIYGLLIALAPTMGSVAGSNRELDPYGGLLPTSMVLGQLFEATVSVEWTDLSTKQVIPNYNPNQPGASRNVGFSERPDRRDFMSVGHALWTLLFGFVGGRIGRMIFLRRTESEAIEAHRTN